MIDTLLSQMLSIAWNMLSSYCYLFLSSIYFRFVAYVAWTTFLVPVYIVWTIELFFFFFFNFDFILHSTLYMSHKQFAVNANAKHTRASLILRKKIETTQTKYEVNNNHFMSGAFAYKLSLCFVLRLPKGWLSNRFDCLFLVFASFVAPLLVSNVVTRSKNNAYIEYNTCIDSNRHT